MEYVTKLNFVIIFEGTTKKETDFVIFLLDLNVCFKPLDVNQTAAVFNRNAYAFFFLIICVVLCTMGQEIFKIF